MRFPWLQEVQRWSQSPSNTTPESTDRGYGWLCKNTALCITQPWTRIGRTKHTPNGAHAPKTAPQCKRCLFLVKSRQAGVQLRHPSVAVDLQKLQCGFSPANTQKSGRPPFTCHSEQRHGRQRRDPRTYVRSMETECKKILCGSRIFPRCLAASSPLLLGRRSPNVLRFAPSQIRQDSARHLSAPKIRPVISLKSCFRSHSVRVGKPRLWKTATATFQTTNSATR